MLSRSLHLAWEAVCREDSSSNLGETFWIRESVQEITNDDEWVGQGQQQGSGLTDAATRKFWQSEFVRDGYVSDTRL